VPSMGLYFNISTQGEVKARRGAPINPTKERTEGGYGAGRCWYPLSGNLARRKEESPETFDPYDVRNSTRPVKTNGEKKRRRDREKKKPSTRGN